MRSVPREVPDAGEDPSRRVTVRDVARAAGVSQATASRALNGGHQVSPDTHQRVLRASRQLGWSANVLARGLRTQRTGTVGLVLPGVQNPYFAEVLEALEPLLAESGRTLLVCTTLNSAATEAQRLQSLISRMVDGLVVVPSGGERSMPALLAAAKQVPTVLIDRYVEGCGLDYVGTDNFEGLRLVLRHLTRTGARSVTYVGASTSLSTAADRLAGFRNVAARRRLTVTQELFGEFSFEWGKQAAVEILDRPDLPDAIVCDADVIAIGVLTVLHQQGIAVPDQIQVTGFDDLPVDQSTYPPLTSVRQAVNEQAAEALRLLDQRAADRGRPASRSVFSPALVLRESTKEAAS